MADLMDFIEFCWRALGASDGSSPDEAYARRWEFAEAVNVIWQRNGVAFNLDAQGRIERILLPEIGDHLQRAQFATGDATLDEMLLIARAKFLDPDVDSRQEALQSLWDAWERLKTIEHPEKSTGIALILDRAAGDRPQFRSFIEETARLMTDIGNNLHIRHSETSQEKVIDVADVDFLFIHLFSFIYFILRKTDKVS